MCIAALVGVEAKGVAFVKTGHISRIFIIL